jgi:P27 family predicted phage terminase small subunit
VGKRGPAPAPTKLKVIRGARPDRVNTAEPSPEDHLPVPPADLVPAAAQVWMRVMAEFGAARVITAADADVLRIYCEAMARYEEASILLAGSGPLVKGARHGDLIKNPLHQIVRDDADLVVRLARELGLTPSARSGLRTGAEQGSELMEYLTRGRRRSA